MKLLQEYSHEIRSHESDTGDIYLEGVVMQMDIVNANNRLYPESVLSPVVEKYIKEKVEQDKAVGEGDHPDNPILNYDRISHKIVDLKKEGKNYKGKIKLLETPMGNIARGLLKGGVRIGISSRALCGECERNSQGVEIVGSPLVLVTAGDLVLDPSAPDAFLQSVRESTEWVVNAKGEWVQQIVEKTKESLKKDTVSQINEKKVEAFKQFIRLLGVRR